MSKTSYLGRHRAVHVGVTARVARTGATAAATTAATAVAAVALMAGPAGAAPAHNWDGVAQCESSGNWHINTGNGFYGGLQFTRSTWLGYGGGAYASRADRASKSEQIAIAERVLRGQGIGAWPVCGRHLGAGSTTSSATAHQARHVRTGTHASGTSRPAPAHRDVATHEATHGTSSSARLDHDGDRDDVHRTAAAAGERYTVRSGDTLNRIATAHHIAGGWQTLARLNRATIENPNLIYPDQRIAL